MKKFDKKKAMGWFIIIFMSLSVVGFMGGSFFTGNTVFKEEIYNGYTFYDNNGWQLDLGGNNYVFSYFPTELEELVVSVDIKQWFTGDKIYLGYKPGDNFSVSRNIQQLGAVFYSNSIMPQQACSVEEGCPDIPIIDCENKKSIILKSGLTGFVVDHNCLVVKAEDSVEMQKLTERLIYKLLGVMN